MHLVIEHRTIFGQEHLLLNPQLIGSQPFLEYRDTVSITEYTQYTFPSWIFWSMGAELEQSMAADWEMHWDFSYRLRI